MRLGALELGDVGSHGKSSGFSMGFSPCPILTFSTWIVQHFLIFALDNCAFGAFGNKLPGSDLLVPRSVLSLGLQGVEIRLNSASNMSNKSLT